MSRLVSRVYMYITTPIYYSNDVPHLGHTGTTVFADIVARYYRALGVETFFLTGTDEHGEKVALAAQKAGQDPQAFVDELAVKWQEYWRELNISNDKFIRTTSVGHKQVVSQLLTKLKNTKTPSGKDAVYEGVYKGIYCVGCEEFKSERDLVDGKCPEHRPDQIEYKEEKNYFFRISEYIPLVKKHMADGTLPVIPANKKNEMLARLSEDIQDTSISRQNVKWGIPLPWDNSQTTYVWVEALMNYYTATQFDWGDNTNRTHFWPADVHFLGKGNNWFHTVIWPSLLLALDLPLPKKVFVHGYYNVDGKKMGKSLGNVISPRDLIDRYGIDGTRFLLAASMPYENDSDVSYKWFDEKYNSALANGLGNLVSRIIKLAGEDASIGSIDNGAFAEVINSYPNLKKAYEEFKLHEVVVLIAELVTELNEYFTKAEPWKKSGAEKSAIIKEAMQKLQIISTLYSPIMPESFAIISNAIVNKSMSKPLFQRIV